MAGDRFHLSDWDPTGISADYKSSVKANRGERLLAENVAEGKAGMSGAQKSQMKTGATDDALRLAQEAVRDAASKQSLGQQTATMIGVGKEAAEAGAQTAKEMDLVSAQLAENRRLESKQDMQEARSRHAETMSNFTEGIGKTYGAGGPLSDGKKLSDSDSLAEYLSDLSELLMDLCWVAREVLPGQWRDCRTYILFRAPSWFRLWYAKNGEETAEWLHAHPWAKPLVRPLFRYFAWRGKRMAQKNPYFIEIQSRLA